jgi:hypothetical protein
MQLALRTVKAKQHQSRPFVDRGVVSQIESRFDVKIGNGNRACTSASSPSRRVWEYNT